MQTEKEKASRKIKRNNLKMSQKLSHNPHKRLFELLRIGKRYTNNAEHCQNYFIVFFQFCTIMDYGQSQTKTSNSRRERKNKTFYILTM